MNTKMKIFVILSMVLSVLFLMSACSKGDTSSENLPPNDDTNATDLLTENNTPIMDPELTAIKSDILCTQSKIVYITEFGGLKDIVDVRSVDVGETTDIEAIDAQSQNHWLSQYLFVG